MFDRGAAKSDRNISDLAIGIIGGIGPAATMEFMRRVLDLTPVRSEPDYVRMLVDCNPKLPDMNAAALEKSRDAADQLLASAHWLEEAGADFLVVICNAAHCFEEHLRQGMQIPLLSMIDAACGAVAAVSKKGSGIGVLATDGCVKADIYGKALRERGFDEISLSSADTRVFLDGLRAIKSDEVSTAAVAQFEYCVDRLVDSGASSIVVACTEAAVALKDGQSPVPYIDPVEELARVAVASAKRIPLDHDLQRDVVAR